MHAVETMAYVGATPWHGLGKNVTDESAMYDSSKFIKECGLDWEAEKRQLKRDKRLPFVNADGSVGYNVETVPANAWEVVRSTDQAVLADSVGARYTILQNKDAFGWFQPWLDAKEAALHTGGALFD